MSHVITLAIMVSVTSMQPVQAESGSTAAKPAASALLEQAQDTYGGMISTRHDVDAELDQLEYARTRKAQLEKELQTLRDQLNKLPAVVKKQASRYEDQLKGLPNEDMQEAWVALSSHQQAVRADLEKRIQHVVSQIAEQQKRIAKLETELAVKDAMRAVQDSLDGSVSVKRMSARELLANRAEEAQARLSQIVNKVVREEVAILLAGVELDPRPLCTRTRPCHRCVSCRVIGLAD